MTKTTKILLIIAIILIIAGISLFAISINKYDFNFNELSNTKYETKTYEITEVFNNISIDVDDISKIEFAKSENDNCQIVIYEDEKAEITTKVEEDTLIINIKDTRKWYEHINISFTNSKMTIYLPKDECHTSKTIYNQ